MKGIKASPGIAIGEAYIVIKDINVEKKANCDTEAEILKFDNAINKSKAQLAAIRDRAASNMGDETAAIFDAHIMILEDPEFIPQVKDMISNEAVNAEYAVKTVVNNFYEMLSSLEDPYLKERAADIKDVGSRLISNILGYACDFSNIPDNSIIVAKDLGPSDTAQLDKNKVLAFLTDEGGKTSHSAIMARIMQIPAIVGLNDITLKAENGNTLIVDGNSGEVIIDPDEKTLNEYKIKQTEYKKHVEKLKELLNYPAETKDGVKVELEGNIGTDRDVETALSNGAEGIGLFRTEFLFMDRDSLPTEDEQFESYKNAAASMKGKMVTIRTLDIGGDKKLPYMNIEKEDNPFLGFRAIRLCLERVDMFKSQLRAILRASAFGKISIMYPMISDINEVRKANKILKKAMEELNKQNIAYDKNIQVGIMVEIPSAAVCADIFAKEVDFFSIGTNDLTQYSLAVDRGNKKISSYYNYFNPAVLRLIKNCIDCSHKYGKYTAMCGEMAGDAEAAKILLGLGLDKFSMSSTSIPSVKEVIRNTTFEEAKAAANKALQYE